MAIHEPTKDPVREALDQLFKDYRDRQIRITRTESMMSQLKAEAAKLQSKIVALARVCDQEIEPDSLLGRFLAETAASGLTNGIRAVLQANREWTTPTAIRDDLLRLGYDLSDYKNVMASIHTVLGRLVEAKEVERILKKGKEITSYRWKSAPSGEDSELAKQLKKDLDYLRTEIKPDPLSKIN